VSHPHDLHEMQEGVGSTGRFGEIFVVLGLLIMVLGGILWGLGATGFFQDPNKIADGGASDAVQSGALFFFEGLGFTAFGAMVMVTGWARHHPDDH
jgi:cytochrome c biogenesis protein ResB